QDHADVREEWPHDAVGHVQLASHRRIHRRLDGGLREEREDRGKEVAGDEEEDRQHHPRHRRGEIEAHLFLEDRPDLHGAGSPAVFSADFSADPSSDSSLATTRMNTSSSVIPTRLSSSSSHRCWAASWKISARTSRPRAASTVYRAAPFAGA